MIKICISISFDKVMFGHKNCRGYTSVIMQLFKLCGQTYLTLICYECLISLTTYVVSCLFC